MSKYIRTKDGRILRVPFTKQEYDVSFPNTTVSYEEWFKLWVFDTQIVKQADTIEELCDEFVAASKDNKYRSLVKIEETGNRWVEDKITQWCEILKDKLVKWDIYGSIWVGPDLRAVAKMNDEGELELL